MDVGVLMQVSSTMGCEQAREVHAQHLHSPLWASRELYYLIWSLRRAQCVYMATWLIWR